MRSKLSVGVVLVALALWAGLASATEGEPTAINPVPPQMPNFDNSFALDGFSNSMKPLTPAAAAAMGDGAVDNGITADVSVQFPAGFDDFLGQAADDVNGRNARFAERPKTTTVTRTVTQHVIGGGADAGAPGAPTPLPPPAPANVPPPPPSAFDNGVPPPPPAFGGGKKKGPVHAITTTTTTVTRRRVPGKGKKSKKSKKGKGKKGKKQRKQNKKAAQKKAKKLMKDEKKIIKREVAKEREKLKLKRKQLKAEAKKELKAESKGKLPKKSKKGGKKGKKGKKKGGKKKGGKKGKAKKEKKKVKKEEKKLEKKQKKLKKKEKKLDKKIKGKKGKKGGKKKGKKGKKGGKKKKGKKGKKGKKKGKKACRKNGLTITLTLRNKKACQKDPVLSAKLDKLKVLKRDLKKSEIAATAEETWVTKASQLIKSLSFKSQNVRRHLGDLHKDIRRKSREKTLLQREILQLKRRQESEVGFKKMVKAMEKMMKNANAAKARIRDLAQKKQTYLNKVKDLAVALRKMKAQHSNSEQTEMLATPLQ